MVVTKRQEWDLYEEEQIKPIDKKTLARPNGKLRLRCFACVITAIIMAMIVAVQSEAIVRAGYNLVQTKAEIAKTEKDVELLRLEIAKLKSPQRIQHFAVNNLGMVIPQAVYRAAGTDSGDAATASGEPTMASRAATLIQIGRAEASKSH